MGQVPVQAMRALDLRLVMALLAIGVPTLVFLKIGDETRWFGPHRGGDEQAAGQRVAVG